MKLNTQIMTKTHRKKNDHVSVTPKTIQSKGEIFDSYHQRYYIIYNFGSCPNTVTMDLLVFRLTAIVWH